MADEKKEGESSGVAPQEREGTAPEVILNPDENVVRNIREGLARTGGYCPCRRDRTPETRCMCAEFRRQIADPDFHGYCHCMLYLKK